MIHRILEFARFPRRKPDVEFVTPLTIQECEKRLFGPLDLTGSLGPLQLMERPIIRSAGNKQFSDVYLRRRIVYRNDLQPVLYCRLMPVANGTYVKGSLWFSPFITLFLTVWWGFICFWSLCLLLALALDSSPDTVALTRPSDTVEASPSGFSSFPVWMILCLPVFSGGWIGASYLIEQRHKPYLITYLRLILLDPSLDPATLEPVSTSAVNTHSDFHYALVTSLIGIVLLVVAKFSRQALPEWIRQTSPVLDVMEGIFPAVIGFSYSRLSTAPNRYANPVRLAAGAVLSSTLVACVAEIVGLDPTIISFPFQMVYASYSFEAPAPSIAHWILIAFTYALYSGLGSYLGWFMYVRQRRTEA
jgi:hypothetical protein